MFAKFKFTLLFAILLVFSLPAFAQENATKESFIKKWEEHIKSLPSTVSFEKTDEENIYTLDTDLFDYNGKIELLNVVISEDIDYYQNYELDDAAKTKGIAEIEFVDAPEKFFHNRYHSKSLWDNNQYLFWIDGQWLTEKDWQTNENTITSVSEDYTTPRKCNLLSRNSVLRVWLPIILLIIFVLALAARTKKCQKEHIAKYDLSLDRQKESIDMVKESLALQKEQNELLKRILEK